MNEKQWEIIKILVSREIDEIEDDEETSDEYLANLKEISKEIEAKVNLQNFTLNELLYVVDAISDRLNHIIQYGEANKGEKAELENALKKLKEIKNWWNINDGSITFDWISFASGLDAGAKAEKSKILATVDRYKIMTSRTFGMSIFRAFLDEIFPNENINENNLKENKNEL